MHILNKSWLPFKHMNVLCMVPTCGTCTAKQHNRCSHAGTCLSEMPGECLDSQEHLLWTICCLASYLQSGSFWSGATFAFCKVLWQVTTQCYSHYLIEINLSEINHRTQCVQLSAGVWLWSHPVWTNNIFGKEERCSREPRICIRAWYSDQQHLHK